MTNQPLTKRQKQVLEAIKKHIRETGKPPTIREIGERFGFASSTIFQHLGALEKKGFIRRTGRPNTRTINVIGLDPAEALKTMKKIPILGRVAAGSPILAQENIEGFLHADGTRIKGDDLFALRVKGDSMTGAGILQGDLVIVRKQNTARNGDIVVALIEDEATIKRLVAKKNKFYLQPENNIYAPIPIDRPNITILGKVICVQRHME